MTVCIASLYRARGPNGEVGRLCALVCSDRMLTAGDVKYEPPQQKMAWIGRHVVVLVAGDIVLHSQAVQNIHLMLTNKTAPDVRDVARLYGEQIRGLTAQQAEHLFLAPLGLTRESFLERQRDMSPALVAELANQLMGHRVDAEALVVGCDNLGGDSHIFHVGWDGLVSLHNDVGFAAIGSGSNHAKSEFMSLSYTKNWPFQDSAYAIYSAKKKAEMAPGVGEHTDIHWINDRGITPVHADFIALLARIAKEREKADIAFRRRWKTRLDEKMEELWPAETVSEPNLEDGKSAGNSRTDGSVEEDKGHADGS